MIDLGCFSLVQDPLMIDFHIYEGVYGNGSILISPYLAAWSPGMLIGSSMGLSLLPTLRGKSLFQLEFVEIQIQLAIPRPFG